MDQDKGLTRISRSGNNFIHAICAIIDPRVPEGRVWRWAVLALAAGWLVWLTPVFADPVIQRHPNGKVSLEGNVDENGLPHKIIRKYNKNGQLISEKNYNHGQLEGMSKLYYPNGQLMTVWSYRDGQREGPSRGYYQNGKLKDKGFYKEDKLDGPVQLYYRNGRVKAEMNFKKGRQEGASKTYTQEGNLEFIYTYRKGRLINRKTFDSQGKLVLDQDYPTQQVLP
ncbi:MAG: hypothetical protein ACE5E9_06550 [Nitrospinaceae bacterium]